MANVDPTTDPAFDIEEDGADALVADFIVSALDQADGTQGYEEDAARFRQQQQTYHHHHQQQHHQHGPEVQIPDAVRGYLIHFYQAFLENDVYEMQGCYENQFNRLTEKFFQKAPWPEADAIAPLVNSDPNFLILYRELYYRHIYARLTPTIDHRFGSYDNYCDLFNFILNSGEPVNLELPHHWAWDIIDEFIFQFQSFCNYRQRAAKRQDDEAHILREAPGIWSCYSVLNVLYSLIQKSQMNEQLAAAKEGRDENEVAGEYGSKPLYRTLGYFSIIGLLRVHCLLGDFTLALKMMDNIELNKKAMFVRVSSCHYQTYYYVGFAYMMLRRYADATKAFANILLFISRTKQLQHRSSVYDQLQKKADQMYALLTICIALTPTRLDDSIHSVLREKYGEQLSKLPKGGEKGELDDAILEELFLFACPKFINPIPPDWDQPEGIADPTAHHLQVFKIMVKNEGVVGTLRSYLKLYKSIEIGKLARFLGVEKDVLRELLLVFKSKAKQVRWEDGSGKGGLLKGETTKLTDLDFGIDNDMVNISEVKVGRRYGDWFVRNTQKYLSLQESLLKPVPQPMQPQPQQPAE